MAPEKQLFLDRAISIAAQMTCLPISAEKINDICDLPGFPKSPEITVGNIRTDNYVLITDTMNECMNHLVEARKCLMLLGIHHLVSPQDYNEKKVPSNPEDIRFEL